MNLLGKIQNSKFKGFFIKSSFSIIFKLLGIVLGYVFTLVVSRNYGAEILGVYALAFTVLRIAGIFGQLGTETAIIKFVGEADGFKKTKDVYRKAFLAVFLFSVGIGGAIFLLHHFLAHSVFKNAALEYPLLIVAFAVLPYTIYALNNGTLRGLRQVNTFAFFKFAFPFTVGLIFLLLFIAYGEKSTYLPILAMSLGYLLGVIINYFLVKIRTKGFKIANHTSEPLVEWNEFFALSIPMLLASSLFLFISWTDTLMLGYFGEEKQVGIYHITLKLATLIGLPLVAINTVIASKFVQLWKKKKYGSVENHARLSSLAAFVISIPILLVVNFYSQTIFSLFGKDFQGGGLALLILSIGYMVNASCGSVGYLMQMTGKEKPYQWIILVAAIINVFLNLFLIPEYGIVGAAIATTASLVIWNFSAVGYLYFKHNMRVTFFIPRDKKNIEI